MAANTQIGKENRQAIFSAETGATAGRDVVTKTLDTQSVETVTIVNERIPTWMLIVFGLLCGFVIPSPPEIFRDLRNAFGRKK